MKTYEALVIFPLSLKDAAFDKAQERLRGEITKAGGAVLKSEMLGSRQFARQMNKQNSGQYVRMGLSLPPENIAGLQARLKLNEDIFRFQIIVAPKPVAVKAAPAPAAAAPSVETAAGR